MKSAEAWVLQDSPSLPGKLQVTSPFPYQSNSGPMSSLSSAMNPSRETTAPMIVLPKPRPFVATVHHHRYDDLSVSPPRRTPSVRETPRNVGGAERRGAAVSGSARVFRDGGSSVRRHVGGQDGTGSRHATVDE